MTITMYGIKNCDTIKKARAWLEERGIAYVFHDYKVAGVDQRWLADRCAEFGWEAVLNRAGTTFRKLPEADKGDLNAAKAVSLMAGQPSMIKRPILDLGETRVIGFRPELYENTFAAKH
ncbi:ArsC family reductase [Telmatospirillum sp.]|uniref:ArsC family reductase n=1 Tax=Telmatospirillum sp. TaxID=2079197 RepID=UPI00283D62F7|nr:ArsC family reductase [Telmatospirillum sp.]MDR3435735.1 ArsC family reductase [Telmatospirillum sp.]